MVFMGVWILCFVNNGKFLNPLSCTEEKPTILLKLGPLIIIYQGGSMSTRHTTFTYNVHYRISSLRYYQIESLAHLKT